MERNTRGLDDLVSINKDVVAWFEQHLPEPFDVKKLFEKFDDKSTTTDEEIYYSYFLYCWNYLIKIYFKQEYNLELKCTQKLLAEDKLILNYDLLKLKPSAFLFYIVLATQEAIINYPGVTVRGDAVEYINFVGEIQHMMTRIDSISYKWKSDMTISIIPSIIYNNKIKVCLNEVESKLSNFKEQMNSVTTSNEWVGINKFLNDAGELEGKIKNQSDLIEQIEGYDKKINKLKTDYNFVNLSNSFHNIRNIKHNELRSVNRFFYFGMFLLLIIPACLLYFNLNTDLDKFKDWNKLIYILPIVTIEIMLLYFLRLFYTQKKSIMAQLLQIDFRLSICEFVSGYIEDKKKNSEEISTWNAFESLVFSPIQIREDKIPSVLDGADSIVELISKVLKLKSETSKP
ncbi:hypothetical protein [Serratia sp. DD3]|uniref:hypothetical protein n=1 Tax=Serratia sp. DD3 TaxID=1410619 RepID=UPI0003C51D1B|nr:hypothetical protein [Serratia sp. DD3]KEY57128.1 hypothetical protein SRDD_39460 [Serratia sp. DD3]